MSAPNQSAVPHGSDHVRAAAVGQARPRARRRSFLVNRRYQLRVAALVAAVALVLLVFLNLTIYSHGTESTARALRAEPQLEAYVKAQDRVMISLVVLGSLVFLVGVFLVSVLETHKTAGACINLTARMDDIRRGRYGTALRLRHDDNLRELEPAFNAMSQALQQATWDDVEVLEELARRIERSPGDLDPAAIASELHALSARMRDRAD